MAQKRDVDAENEDVADWRRRIDVIDEQLLRLINSRSACAIEIGRVKRAMGLPIPGTS